MRTILLILCLLNPVLATGICSENRHVVKTRWLLRTYSHIKTYRANCWYFPSCVKSHLTTHTRHVVQTYYATEDVRICCNGYREKTKNPLDCAPICIPYCVNGFCLKPGQCECNAGYKKKHINWKCEPDCPSGCLYGICTSPGVCSCNKGYNKFNGTSCLPVCSRPCVNGKCVAPEQCECLPGYKSDINNKYECVPECVKPCVNGECIAPGKCQCFSGYQLNSSTEKCEPFCSQSCVNGTCVKPESCECFEGYEKQTEYTCVPHCSSTCENGLCIAPDVCGCLPGYSKDPQYVNKCIPVCEQACTNGICVGPDKCQCLKGYDYNGQFECKPICSKECYNADCIAPETCNCRDGYKESELANKCEPLCHDQCINAICTAPDECTCFKGYVPSNETNVCVPFCSFECLYGECTAPDTCSCSTGYSLVGNNLCRPVCSIGCINGYCSQPEVCSCPEGLSLDEKNATVCVRVCSDGQKCENGYCSELGRCESDEVHERSDEDSEYYAVTTVSEDGSLYDSLCSEVCVNSNCTDREECTCHSGYEKDVTNPYVCNPLCEQGCENRRCTSLNECQCYGDRELVNNSKCVPHARNLPAYSRLLNFAVDNAVMLNDTENSFVLEKKIEIVMNKSCLSIVRATNKYNSCNNTYCPLGKLVCMPLSTEFSNITYQCSWDNMEEENVSATCNNQNIDESDLALYNKTDLHLDVKLFEEFHQLEDGICKICLCRLGQKVDFQTEDELTLQLGLCKSQGESLMEKITALHFLIGAVIFSSALLIAWFIYKRNIRPRQGGPRGLKWQTIQMSECDIEKTGSSEVITESISESLNEQ